MMKHCSVGLLAVVVMLTTLTACATQHKVETVHKVEVQPMHITIDINLKVDKALDDFFGDIDDAEGEPIPEKK